MRAAVVALLALEDAATSPTVRAARAVEQLTQRLALLVGEIGVTALFKRSMVLASVEFPWLTPEPAGPKAIVGPAPHVLLSAVMEKQPAAIAGAGFGAVMCTFVVLLERLIGERLVRIMFEQAWPAAFRVEKETS